MASYKYMDSRYKDCSLRDPSTGVTGLYGNMNLITKQQQDEAGRSNKTFNHDDIQSISSLMQTYGAHSTG